MFCSYAIITQPVRGGHLSEYAAYKFASASILDRLHANKQSAQHTIRLNYIAA